MIRRGNGNQSGIVRRRDGGRRRGIGDHSRGCDSIRLRFHEMTQPLCLAGRTRLFRVVAARMCRLVGLQSQNLRTRKAVSPVQRRNYQHRHHRIGNRAHPYPQCTCEAANPAADFQIIFTDYWVAAPGSVATTTHNIPAYTAHQLTSCPALTPAGPNTASAPVELA